MSAPSKVASSSWARDDDEHQKKYYDPAGKTNRKLDTWRRFMFQFGMIWDSPVSMADKAALSVYIARWMRWERHALIRELHARGIQRSPQA